MSQSLSLYRLQKLDSKIGQINNRLSEIEQTLSDDQRLINATKRYDKAKAEATKFRIHLNQIEDKVEAQRIKRKTTQASLFSGRIKNPKELQDLQMESEALKRYIAQLEDEQLDAMIAFETAEEAEKKAEKDLKQAKGTTAEENAALLGEKSNLEQDLERLVRERDAVLQSIPENNIQLYNNLRKTKRGLAVAGIFDGSCSVCGQPLTPADLQSIRGGNMIVYCPSCRRIIFES